MTNNQNTAFTVAANTLNECDVNGIYIEAAQMEDCDTFKQLVRSAAAFLSRPVAYSEQDYYEDEDGEELEDRPETFDPLSLEYFVNQRTGEYIADVDLTVGGPSIWARYESRRGRITLYAAWGSDRLECSTDECPLIDWIKDMAPAE